MRQWKIGRVTLALTLIFIGISILFSLFYDNNFLYSTIKFWPIIIIILGIEMLISAFFSGNEKIKVKVDVISIILIIVFLGSYTAVVIGTHFVKNFNQFQHFGINFNNYNYGKIVERKFFIKTVNEFELENRYSGDMIIEPSDGTEVEVIASITFNYNDENLIDENIEKSFSIIGESNSKLLLNNIANKNIEIEKVNLKVKVPKGINISLKNSFGNITASNINGDVSFYSKNGEVNMKNISGKVKGENGYGNTKLNGINGEVKIAAKNGDLDIKNISVNLNVENSYGKTVVENIGGDAEISADNGEIVAKDVKGISNVSSKYGEMDLENLIKGGKIESKNGNIKLVYSKKLQGNLSIKSSYGDIKLLCAKGQEGSFNCKTQHGSVNTSLPLQKNDDEKNDNIKGNIGSSTNSFTIDSKNGSITID